MLSWSGGLRDHEAIALHEDALAGLQVEGLNAPRIAAREADFARHGRAEVGQEQRLAHELAFHRAPELFAERFAASCASPRTPAAVCRPSCPASANSSWPGCRRMRIT